MSFQTSYYMLKCYSRLVHKWNTRLLHYVPDSVVIASAVRTPWVHDLSQKYPTVTPNHLGAMVVDEAVKQSGAPLEKVEKVIMSQETLPIKETAYSNRIFGELVKKAEHISVSKSITKSIFMGINELSGKAAEITVVGGVKVDTEEIQPKADNDELAFLRSKIIKDYDAWCKQLHKKASVENIFDAELIPLILFQLNGPRKQQVRITQDECLDFNKNPVNGAAAMVMTTPENAEKYNITPLAMIKDIQVKEKKNDDDNDLTLTQDVLESMVNFNTVPVQNIKWMLCMNHDTIFNLQTRFQIPWENINPYGCVSPLTQCNHEFLLSNLSHLTHTLQTNEYGCVLSSNDNTAIAVLIQKLPSKFESNDLPRLTLFTINNCCLCEGVIEDLEENFAGEYKLEKVFIDAKENVRYLRLYRRDIPVLHLNGQFLCMHSLNVKLLRRKLDLLKSLNNARTT